MTTLFTPIEPNDIDYDLEGTQKAAAAVARFFAQEPPRTKAGTLRGADPLQPLLGGRRLLAASPPETVRRFETLLWMESVFRPDGDYAYLIAPACQLLESELHRLLMEPVRPLLPELIAALGTDSKARKRAAILDDWAAGRKEPTIGTQGTVLYALRHGLEQQRPALEEFLRAEFEPLYVEALRTGALDKCLNQVRDAFRNPACHGTACFTADQYGRFVQLVVASPGFAVWGATGPSQPPAEGAEAVLHRHLCHARRNAPASVPLVERWLGLHTPPYSPLAVRLRVERAAAPAGLRDLGPAAPPGERPLVLGDAVYLVVQANHPCHVVLVDRGTSGRLVVVRPNAGQPETRLEAGQPVWVPEKEGPAGPFVLTGEAGVERVKALATIHPLTTPLLPTAAAGYRTLTHADLASLIAEVEQLPVSEWAAADCAFVIRAER